MKRREGSEKDLKGRPRFSSHALGSRHGGTAHRGENSRRLECGGGAAFQAMPSGLGYRLKKEWIINGSDCGGGRNRKTKRCGEGRQRSEEARSLELVSAGREEEAAGKRGNEGASRYGTYS